MHLKSHLLLLLMQCLLGPATGVTRGRDRLWSGLEVGISMCLSLALSHAALHMVRQL